MVQLAYVSSTKGFLTVEALLQILILSRIKNRAAGITGMLLYRDGNVLQVIEGAQAPVETLFDVIKADPRHTGVIKLYQHEIPERDFPNWEMAFREVSAEELRGLDGFSDFLAPGSDLRSLKPSAAMRLLASFRKASR